MPVEYRRPDLSIDQQLALTTAAANLAREFDDPAGLDLDDVRPIRDEIDQRVRALIADLTTVTTHDGAR